MNFQYKNEEIIRSLLDTINELSFVERFFIKKASHETIKDIMFYNKEALEKLQTGEDKIIRGENEKNKKMIVCFQVEKSIEDKIEIIEDFIEKYQKSKDVINNLLDFFKKELEELKELSRYINDAQDSPRDAIISIKEFEKNHRINP